MSPLDEGRVGRDISTKLPKPNPEDLVLDLTKIKRFNQDHLDASNYLLESTWKVTYPELFLDEYLPPAIRFSHLEIVDRLVTNRRQSHRAGGSTITKKYKQIKQNIERNGFKLKYPPISVLRWSFKEGDTSTITGDTRTEIVSHSPFDMENLIVAIYEKVDGYSDEQVQDAIELCGGRFNSIHDAAGELTLLDAKRIVERAIARWIETDGEAGIPATIDAITARVHAICGEGVFQPQVRQNLILEIYNNTNLIGDTIISWNNNKGNGNRISNFLKRIKWVDTDTVKYLHVANSMGTKAFRRACKVCKDNPGVEVRIVVHTSTLTGYDMLGTYENRLRQFIMQYEAAVDDISAASDSNPTWSRIKVYGALPALSSDHDTEAGVYFNSRTRTFYQKNNDYSFDLDTEYDLEDFLEE